LPTKTLRAWAGFLKSDDAAHFEVRGGAFYTLTEEQLTALKASASEFPLVPSAPTQMQGFASNYPSNFGQHMPYGFQPHFDPHGMHPGFPYGFQSAFSPVGGFAPSHGLGPGMGPGLAPGLGPGMGVPGYPANLQRPSTVQVSEIDEQPHITSLIKHNRKLFDALVAAYPNKCISLLSAPQLKALVNKYGKECDKQPPPPTRSRRAADASEPKKKHKRRAEEDCEEGGEDEAAADEGDGGHAEKQDKSKPDKADKADRIDKAKKAGKSDKSRARKKAKHDEIAQPQE